MRFSALQKPQTSGKRGFEMASNLESPKRLILATVHVSTVLAIGSNQASSPNASVNLFDKASSSD